MKTVAIVNPAAGYRRATRLWPRLLQSLGEPGARVATWWTRFPRHAEALTGDLWAPDPACYLTDTEIR